MRIPTMIFQRCHRRTGSDESLPRVQESSVEDRSETGEKRQGDVFRELDEEKHESSRRRPVAGLATRWRHDASAHAALRRARIVGGSHGSGKGRKLDAPPQLPSLPGGPEPDLGGVADGLVGEALGRA